MSSRNKYAMGLGDIVRLLYNVILICQKNGLADQVVSQAVQLLYKLHPVTEFRHGPILVVIIHIQTPTGEGNGFFGRCVVIHAAGFAAGTTHIAGVTDAAVISLAAAGTIGQITGGSQLALIKDQIATASAIEPCLPPKIMRLIEEANRFSP